MKRNSIVHSEKTKVNLSLDDLKQVYASFNELKKVEV
jgi:hypothetical protein